MSAALVSLLDRPASENRDWYRRLGLADPDRAQLNLRSLARSGITLDLLSGLIQQLEQQLPGTSDPDRALNNLERFVAAARSPLALASLFERDPTGLPILLTLFSSSQYLSDLLIRDTESYDALRLGEGQLHTRDVVVDEIVGEIGNASDAAQAMALLRRFKHRETLRIGFGDLIVGHRIQQVTEQISWVADAICTAAVTWCRRTLETKWGIPLNAREEPAGYVILAMGKLGGAELNYSSDVDLVMVYEEEGRTTEGRSNREFFERLTRDVARLLGETTELGAAYRVDMRLRPDGRQGRVCNSCQGMLQYYDLNGRTWERQALIKARPVAGDLALGQRLIDTLQPWIFRRNLDRAAIGGIQSLKRQIEKRALAQGHESTNVKTGHGGIRDIEFVIQFLQLLNGHDHPEVRGGNTLDAIESLSRVGALSLQESVLLAQNYNWLRKVEHRLQILFDVQTHTLPQDPLAVEQLAVRMGYERFFENSPADQFENALGEITETNRRILDHVLHRPFGDEDEGQPVPLIVDALLHPEPDTETIGDAMAPYRFRQPESAFTHLQAMTREKTRFLSQSRCRHFFAAIAHGLLLEISTTPDPDATLVALRNISDSIGGKAVLWELFNTHPTSLRTFVRLGAASDYLASILVGNPGMIDALIDSLMMDQLPSADALRGQLAELARGAEDLEPIIHSFKDSQHLRIGVRDILQKDPIEQTHAALADLAEICIQTIATTQFQRLAERHFRGPVSAAVAEACGFCILAMGKLGGREPNYHSDLDVVFLYQTLPEWDAYLKPETSWQYFFSQLAAAISKSFNHRGRYGKLYELDSRLRPTGKSGSLAVSLAEFERYFESGDGQLWERQALCKARPIFGAPEVRDPIRQAVWSAIVSVPWAGHMAGAIHRMRLAMQDNSTPRNLKRGVGGTVDVEFGVQMLQLATAGQHPDVLVPGTIQAIERLVEAGPLEAATGNQIAENYRLLRSVESRLRLMNTTARHDLPQDPEELAKLAYLLNYPAERELEQDVNRAREFNREWFLKTAQSLSY